MGIKEFLNRFIEKKRKFKDYSDDIDIQEQANARRMTADERELLRFQEEARQKAITSRVKQLRKIKFKQDNYGHQILANGTSICDGKSMLKERNIFTNQPKLFEEAKHQFFRW